MEADDETALKSWASKREDLIEFEIIPVRTSGEAAAAITPKP